jgi:hypothetical protein
LPHNKNDNSKLLLAALAVGALAALGLLAWRLIARNAPGASGPYLIPDNAPTATAGGSLLADEPLAGPSGDPFGIDDAAFLLPIAMAPPKPRRAKPKQQGRATYKRKKNATAADEEISAVVPPSGGSQPAPAFASDLAPPPPAPSPPPPAAPVEPPAPVELPVEPPVPAPVPPPVVVPEIEDVDLSAPMDLALDDVAMDVDFGEAE